MSDSSQLGRRSETLAREPDVAPSIGSTAQKEAPWVLLADCEWPVVSDGRYVIAGERARGGLGRILQASDKRLDRPIALKELLSTEQQAEARFFREALVTARLQHPAIVPIYDVGRWMDGKPFYAMKMVSGRSLAEVIKERRSLDERLALVPNVIAVAEAIAYAHQHRVIHRDLKPANILIGPFGETLVIDWGLAADLSASVFERPAVPSAYHIAASGLTIQGTILGTPEYMPAEQAAGQPVDERADVYALGAILYHVLAGVPPYSGSSSDEVLKALASKAPVPIERRQPGVPEDLASIVRKAMARDAKERYSSAIELTEDLRRFQTGQLINARHYSSLALLARWFQRHRAAMGAASLILLSLIAGLLATSWQAHIARIERSRAERSFADVRQLANSFLFEFHDAISKLPGSTPARVLLVKRAREYLERLAGEPGAEQDLSLQEELAAAFDKLGQLQGLSGVANLGDTAGALESFQRALAIRTTLAKTDKKDVKAQAALAETHYALSDILLTRGDRSDARRHASEAVQISEATFATSPTSQDARRTLVKALDRLSNILVAEDDLAGTIQIRRRLLKLAEDQAVAAPADPASRRMLALMCKKLGATLEKSADLPSAIDLYRRALTIDEDLVRRDENNARARLDLSYSYGSIGLALFKAGEIQQALDNYSRALKLREGIAASDPSNADAQSGVAGALSRIGLIQRSAGNWIEARNSYLRAEAIWRSLGSAQSDLGNHSKLATVYLGLGKLHLEWALADRITGRALRERIDEARGWFQRSLNIWMDLQRRGAEDAEAHQSVDEIAAKLKECDMALISANK
jgi:serine/threonine protein kinase